MHQIYFMILSSLVYTALVCLCSLVCACAGWFLCACAWMGAVVKIGRMRAHASAVYHSFISDSKIHYTNLGDILPSTHLRPSIHPIHPFIHVYRCNCIYNGMWLHRVQYPQQRREEKSKTIMESLPQARIGFTRWRPKRLMGTIRKRTWKGMEKKIHLKRTTAKCPTGFAHRVYEMTTEEE